MYTTGANPRGETTGNLKKKKKKKKTPPHFE